MKSDRTESNQETTDLQRKLSVCHGHAWRVLWCFLWTTAAALALVVIVTVGDYEVAANFAALIWGMLSVICAGGIVTLILAIAAARKMEVEDLES